MGQGGVSLVQGWVGVGCTELSSSLKIIIISKTTDCHFSTVLHLGFSVKNLDNLGVYRTHHLLKN